MGEDKGFFLRMRETVLFLKSEGEMPEEGGREGGRN